jgi:hypothetical protein
MFGPGELIVLLVMGGGFLGLGGYLLGLVAYHAYRRGYNPVVWGLAAVFAMNPVFLLVVLVLVPHRSRLRLRARFAAELDAKLAGHGGDRGTPGDLSVLPETQAGRGGRSPVLDATRTYSGPDRGGNGDEPPG